MPSRADVDRLVSSSRDIRALVARDLNAFWSTLDLSDPGAVRDALIAFMPSLVDLYGDVAATVAADWYADVRSAAGVVGRFTPVLAANVPASVIEPRIRYAARHLFTDTPDLARSFLVDAVGTYVLQSGRDTMIASASRDRWKPRIARVPTGATTCAFCLVLASRGAVYASVESAGKFNKYHNDCDCQVVPIGRGDDFPDGYDPEALLLQYQAAQQSAESGSFKGVIAELRVTQGTN